MEKYIELRKKARSLKPIINVGKNGLTETLILEIEKTLKQKKLLKIKLNKGSLENSDKKEIVKLLLEKTGAELIDFVGFNVVLYKK